MLRMPRLGGQGLVALLLLASSGLSVGQTQQSPATVQPVAETGGLAEVVVTARRKEELLQNVPLAVTAFSSEEIQQRGILDLHDIAALTPGFSFQSYGGSGFTQPVIRGAAQIAMTLEQNVSFFLDGIYLPTNYVTNLGLGLLNDVEVVEGPQSARYGRNAFMGAVNYVSRTPTEDFTATATGTVGNHENYDGMAVVSGAVIPGTLRLLGGIDYKSFGGTWPNLAPFCNIGFSTGTGCELGAYERITVNGQAQLLLGDNFTMDFSYYRWHFIDGGNAQNWFAELGADSQELNCGQYNANVRPAGSGLGGGGQWYRLYCGPIATNNTPQDPRGYALQLHADLYKSAMTWKVADDFTVSNLAGYIGSSSTSLDYKDVPGCTFFIPGLCIFEDGPLSWDRQISDDLRVTFDNHGPLSVTLGANYTHFFEYTTHNFVGTPPLTAVPTHITDVFNPADFVVDAVLFTTVTKNSIWSPFGEINYSFLDGKGNVGIEARYQSEHKSQESVGTSGGNDLEVVPGSIFAGTFNSFTPRYTLDYKVTPDVLAYASAAKGVHAGGFNSTAVVPAGATVSPNATYGPDQNWTYELGVKSKLLDDRLILNGDVYYIYWKNQQIVAQDPLAPPNVALPLVIIRNLGTVYSEGVELSAAYVPIRQHLTLRGSLAYNDAVFAHGTIDASWARSATEGAVCDNVVCAENGYIGGHQTPNSSRIQATIGAEWKDALPIGRDMEYFARFDSAYQSRQYLDDLDISWISGRTLTNVALGLTSKNWEVQLWSRNLLDVKYVASVLEESPNMGYDSYLGDRRTFGLTAKVKY